MRLFVREHLPLIGIQILQFAVVILVYWLDGYRNWPTALYAAFLGMVGLAGYLSYRWFSHLDYYRRLSEPLESLEASIQSRGRTPASEALDRLLSEQFRLYQGRLQAYEQKRNEHHTFMNQWVHQMKTPLSVIQLTVQDRDEPDYASIREEADRLEKGLETVLYAARLESFKHDFRVEPVSLKQIADTAVHENKRLFIRHAVYPEVRIAGEMAVQSDAKWLLFALQQLVVNAIKYSPENGKVAITAYPAGQDAVLEVRDRGIGIPLCDQRRVFEPFYTGENGRRFRESTGMGLYLVREICRKLGHEVELESREGEGTVVRLVFRAHLPELTTL